MFTLRRIAYLLFVTCAAYAAHYLIASPQTAWIIPVTFTLALVTAGRTLAQRQLYIFVMGLALIMTSVVASFLVDNTILLLAYLIVFMLLYMRFIYRRVTTTKVFVLFVFLTIIFASRFVEHESDLERSGIIMLGMMIAMLSQLLFWPVLFRDNVSRALKNASLALKETNHAIFNCLLSPIYRDELYEFEREVHLKKRRLLSSLTILQQALLDKKNHPLWHHLLQERVRLIETVFENMLDYAQLRWRVADQASFELCKQELQTLMIAVDQILDQLEIFMMQRQYGQVEVNTLPLKVAVEKFESIYQSVLKTSVREPLAFFLFMASFNGLIDRVTVVGGV